MQCKVYRHWLVSTSEEDSLNWVLTDRVQSNLNEYVEALITLKQKIINTDNLLTEYQKKFSQLQFARRENSTLHHQVEQMLQKISPLQKCQEELGSLKAELEEKKSSLKLYQDTHQEYARVKEECLKSDAQKKKLEAKVKKLEEAAVKQTQDFKQLRNEKKILEKEFKKTQERLDEFSKQKSEKELRHIGTQISSDSYGSIDKRKVKLLLKELWLCVNSAHRLPGEGSRCVPEEPAKEDPRPRASGEDDSFPSAQGSPPRASGVQTCLTKLSVEMQADFAAWRSVDTEQLGGAKHCTSRVVCDEDRSPEGLLQSPNDWDRTDFASPGHFLDRDLQAAMDFFKLPPPLLSPVPSPPRTSSPYLDSSPSVLDPEAYFGRYTDSSDNDSARPRNSADSVSEDDVPESQDYFGLSRKNEASGAWKENPRSQEAVQALNKLAANTVAAGGLVTFTAASREPSATPPVAQEKPWTVASGLQIDRQRDVLGEIERPMGIRERAESLQAERTRHTPGPGRWGERFSSSLAGEKGSATGESPLHRRPLNEHVESAGESSPSRVIGPHTSEFTKWTLTEETALEADCVTGSSGSQRASGEMAKDPEGRFQGRCHSGEGADTEAVSSLLGSGPVQGRGQRATSCFFFAEAAVSGGCPVEETPCRDPGTLGTDARAIASDSPSTSQKNHEPSRVAPGTPGAAFPEYLVTAGPAFSSALCSKAETRDISQRGLPGASFCCAGIREVGEKDSEVEGSESAFSCSESELEAEGLGRGPQDAVDSAQKALGDIEAGGPETGASLEVGDLTSALQEFNLSPSPDIDRLSASGVLMFLESCQLRDCSSGDSVSECSSKGALSKEVDKELKPRGISGEKCGEQPCEEEILGTPGEWIEAEDDDCSLKAPSPLAQCSLEIQAEVLSRIGQELETNHEDCNGNDTGNLLLLNLYNSLTVEDLKEKVPFPQEVTPHPPELPLPTAAPDVRGSSPARGGDHTESRPEDSPEAPRPAAHRQGPSAPAEPNTVCADLAAEVRTRHSPACEAEVGFQCQVPTATSEAVNMLITETQSLVTDQGESWVGVSGVAISPDTAQVALCGTHGDVAVSQGQGGLQAAVVSVTSVERSPDPALQEPLCGRDLPGAQEDVSSSGQGTSFDKSRLRNRPVKPSIWISSQIYDQAFETPNVTSDHTYYNSKLEISGKSKTRSKISNRDQPNKPAKTLAPSRGEAHQSEVPQPGSGDRGNTKTPRGQTQPILAKADTSTPTDCPLDTLSKIRQEVGPPLPPLLAPLIATPPRTSQPLSPLTSIPSPCSPASPADPISPSCEIPGPPVLSPWSEEPRLASPPGPSPSPCAAMPGGRTMSSPLQFCAATPKHALPVPGRLPPCAPGHATPVGGPQENSVKILDTMYPELSARARTLSILKGNLQLSRGPSADGKTLAGPVSALIGLKAITSSSTAFVKTGGSSGGDSSQDRPRDSRTQHDSGGKRTLSASSLRSAKRLRLDSESPEPETTGAAARRDPKNPPGNPPQAGANPAEQEGSCTSAIGPVSQVPLKPKDAVEPHDKAIARALQKIAEASFDLLPVIRSHVYVGNISKKPVMRDQEKEVVYEFSTTKKHLAECLLRSILSELKIQRVSVDHNYMHALCRVYVGICRQLGDLARARLFCYSLLKEDFPESEKLTLFIANMWHDVFVSQSVISKAMQLVARQRAKGEVLSCLKAFLNWEKNAPVDVGIMVSKLLLTIQLCPKTEFQPSEKFGEDLSDSTWEYIFAIDLLCSHQKWVWTHDNIISKELWPVMDKWIKYRKGHANVAYTPDVIIASILRLIGRLGQLGLKEGFPTTVKNISSVIGVFVQHAQDEDLRVTALMMPVGAFSSLNQSALTRASSGPTHAGLLCCWVRRTLVAWMPGQVLEVDGAILISCTEAQGKDIPWGVQLAAVYALCDLSPSSPEETLKTLEAWRRETPKCIPSAIASCLEEVGSLRAEERG
ncbi:hypothetical protein GW7_18020 [Heterocephalus glaber]|uniref:Little elongation complex subunit 1 C-terminal domain-containing protein n=1 Tax=Heterocephalus glaber TaxID=10181 RepID=G5BJC5_HETGA|nr:hypothetical protein GW7_18020 [Heterocephalus glaber]